MSVTYYRVGGAVRDSLLGLKSKDIDYAVEAGSYEEMLADLKALGAEIFLEKPEYLTVRAKMHGEASDYVLCRKDGAYYDGRHPDTVTPGTIYDDLARRDFTINAMAVHPVDGLIDPHGGEYDLKMRHLRTVGSAQERFREDGLRMLRALRFSITKGLTLNKDIVRLLKDYTFVHENIKGVSVERVREELAKCFAHDTYLTIQLLGTFDTLTRNILHDGKLWFKPTLETR